MLSKIEFSDGTRFTITDGASLDNITVVADDVVSMETLATTVGQKGNLDRVFFLFGPDEENLNAAGKYYNMKLSGHGLFRVTQKDDKKFYAVLSITEKTEEEKRLDAIEAGQTIQDGAISEIGDVISSIGDE